MRGSLTLSLLVAASLSGCTNDSTPTSDMEAMHAVLGEVATENVAYSEAAHVETTLSGLVVLADGHAGRMNDLFDTMSMHMGNMQGMMSGGMDMGMDHAGMMGNMMDGMYTMHGDMTQMMNTHVMTMHSVATMPAGMAEVDGHVAGMINMISGMHQMLENSNCPM